jgi:hypothetical protein
MARMTLSYQNLYDEVSHFLGYTARGTSPTGQQLTDCKNIVDRGMRRFLYPVNMETGQPHEWQFLKQFYTFTTIGSKWKYALPVDFADISSTIFYDSDEQQPPLEKREAEQILDMRSDVVSTEWPQYYAIVPLKYDLERGTSYEMWLYPNPDQAYVLQFYYRMDPIKLSATTDLHVGGIRAAEAILETCFAVAEVQEDDVVGIHSQLSEELIQKLIKFDTTIKSHKLGNLYDDRGRDWPPKRQRLVPYSDSNIYP